MAFIQVNVFSNALMRQIALNVILPMDVIDYSGKKKKKKDYRTLYLLHGATGNYMDWVLNTGIYRYAEQYQLAVVMISGENEFYQNYPEYHNNYEDFVGRELVELTRNMFHLSERKEDTFIGGYSMGGYGALHAAFSYPDTFGAVIGLSNAIIFEMAKSWTNDYYSFLKTPDYMRHCFGDLEKAEQSEKNLVVQVRRMAETHTVFPKIFLSCGQEDHLYEPNLEFYKLLKELGITAAFERTHGKHDWDFWDYALKCGMEWLTREGREE